MKLPLVLALLAAHAAAAEKTQIVIEAGDYDRCDTVVEFKLPAGMSPTAAVTSDGQNVALQIGPNGAAWFIEPDLKRGTKKTYTLGDGAVRHPVTALAEKGTVTLRVFGRTALIYRGEKKGLPENRPDLTPIFERGGWATGKGS